MKYSIKFDKANCAGCGACTSCENWKFDDSGEISPLKIELDKIGCNQEAADMCPAEVIKIIEH